MFLYVLNFSKLFNISELFYFKINKNVRISLLYRYHIFIKYNRIINILIVLYNIYNIIYMLQ